MLKATFVQSENQRYIGQKKETVLLPCLETDSHNEGEPFERQDGD